MTLQTFPVRGTKTNMPLKKSPDHPEVLGFMTSTSNSILFSDFCLCFDVLNCAQTLTKWQQTMSRKNYYNICSFLTTKLLTSILFSFFLFFFYIFLGREMVSFWHSPYIKPTTQLLNANITS